MIPRLRGLVVTTLQEGSETGAYTNITFVVPNCDARSVDLAQALREIAQMMIEGKIKERPVADRREFIQPV